MCVSTNFSTTRSRTGITDDKAHEIAVELSLVDGALLIAEVRDDGAAFDPRQAAAPAFDGSIGGLGIHFVRSLMDQVDYARVGNCNVVKISKKLQPGCDPREAWQAGWSFRDRTAADACDRDAQWS